jgi:hypothetical protein
LRKNVSGTVSGFIPESRTWETKLVICATTRHGAVTGETSGSSAIRRGWAAEVPERASARALWTATTSSRSSAVVVAAVSTGTARDSSSATHHTSAVRRTERVMG